MPLLNLPIYLLLSLNILGWPIIQLSFAWLFLRIPTKAFRFNALFPAFQIELLLYEKLFFIKHWKDLLPDGASLFRNTFPKRHLQKRDSEYFARFILESRRAECAHWSMLLAGGVFILWNPPWAILVMVIYAILVNLPCIFAQRYNRLRLRLICDSMAHRTER